MTTFDWIAAERVQLADLLDVLSPEQVAKNSLCGAWRVHDVAGHMVVPLTISLPGFAITMVRAAGNFDRANDRLARAAARQPIGDIAGILRTRAGSHFTPPGFGPEAPLTDLLIHGQDIRRPLGVARSFESERITFVLDFLCTTQAARAFTRRGISDGVRLQANDLDWTHGDGPVVQGPAEALMMALAGRPVALADLSGDGVAVLRSR